MAIDKIVEKRLDNKEGLTGYLALQWRVFPTEIVNPAPTFLYRATKGDGSPEHPWARWPGGVLVAKGIEGGKPVVPVRVYDPTALAGRLLLETTRIDPDDNDAILAFVNEWGLLGVAEPDNEVQLYDSLLLTREQFRNIRRLTSWLQAMQNRKWKSPVLPSFDEIKGFLPGASTPRTPKRRRQLYGLAFQQEFNKRSWGSPVRPLLVSDGSGFKRYLRPLRLLDVLYIELWRVAFARDTALRQCSECKGLFSVKKSNRLKAFCTAACKTRRNFRRWYARPKNRKKLRQKRKVK